MKLSDKTKKQILAVVVAIVVFIICTLINKYLGDEEGDQADDTKAPTEVAKVTNTPKPTKEAKVTEEAKPTKEEKVTNTPKPTKKATSTPKPTKAATATPKPTKATTATPKPTKAATATPKPTKAPSDGRPVYEEDLVFANKSTWESHFEKHGGEFDGLYKTKEEYVAGANKVIHNPKSLYKTEKEDGDHIFYLEETNEFVVVATFGKIRTYFKPSGGKKYFDRQ